MNISLLLFTVFCTRAELFDSRKSRSKSSASDENFEEELEEGYQLLKDEPNADDTKKLLQHLHKIEPEIKQKLTLSPEREVELQEAIENYSETRKDNIADAIEEINEKSKINRALFQGDMLLTREQVEEVLEDVKESEAKHRKRQAYRDKWYPKTLWSDGVYYAFHSNTTDAAKRVFRKAALLWQSLTCIKFTEDRNASNKILVIKETGCWSHVGRTGGTQGLSLGKGCETV
ncbi:unnamed protein product [Angiostrongylus costaricensis]|uniref:Astacin domain-containing protein n=1 Tax=Angiostrongylus costaricensis TaxID=334426 RepID=A0A0R3PHZ6_ANGCS|nr:unnamed protein product [Angiostrongylus costaricensis]